jgi:ABC-type antimicrobial peptide transport system permease subunit
MVKNYLKIAWRNITKNPFYSGVNIVGLAGGITFTMLVSAYVWNEARVNTGLKNAGDQYILQSKWKNPDQGQALTTLGPLAKALHDNYPALVANYYRYDGITSNVSTGDKSFREGLQVCDSTMLDMYGFRLLQGNPQTAFDGPFSVVITADKAVKYFGKTDVLGQTLTIENFSGSKHDFMVTGVLAKFPRNSITNLVDDYPNDIYISSANLGFFGRNMDWNNSSIAGYVQLQKGVKPKDLEKPLKYLIAQNTGQQTSANLTAYLVPLKEYYLASNNGLIKKMLYALSAIALFILSMAVINFINMSVSRSSARMREIGIRKVLGGLKRQLIVQFLAESILLVSLATLLAIAGYLLTRDLFGSILGKEIPSIGQFPLYFMAFPLLLILVTGIIAGIYPAFVLSSLKSVESLKGKLSSVKENVLLRKSLAAFQFGTAILVFSGAIVISQQINFFFSGDLGYNKDYIISAQVPRDWSPAGVSRMEAIRSQFASLPQVSSTTLSFEVPDGNNSGNFSVYKAGADSATAIVSQLLMTDEYYASAYGIPMAAGVFYSRPGAYKDSSLVVINEAQAKALAWSPTDAVGQQLRIIGGGPVLTVAGVTKDFHFGSMQKAIQPVVFLHVGVTNTFRFLSFKVRPGNMDNTLAALQHKWSALMPGIPFEYKFMDDTLKKLYKTEIQLKQASYAATILSFLIVLLGVTGMVSLSIQKRTKEIGIRKVLGSPVAGIILLFMKEFLSVIVIAVVAACPVAWFVMHGWLNDYTYRISLTAKPFLLSVAALALITAILITTQTIRSAFASPVKNLRVE